MKNIRKYIPIETQDGRDFLGKKIEIYTYYNTAGKRQNFAIVPYYSGKDKVFKGYLLADPKKSWGRTTKELAKIVFDGGFYYIDAYRTTTLDNARKLVKAMIRANIGLDTTKDNYYLATR